MLKSMFSKKTTKMSSNFEGFSEYMNFIVESYNEENQKRHILLLGLTDFTI